MGLQNVKRMRRAFLTRPPNSEFHNHDGQAQNDEEDEIEQHEGSSAIFSDDIRESPYVAQANRASCGNKQKTEARREVLARLAGCGRVPSRHETPIVRTRLQTPQKIKPDDGTPQMPREWSQFPEAERSADCRHAKRQPGPRKMLASKAPPLPMGKKEPDRTRQKAMWPGFCKRLCLVAPR